MTYPSEEVKEDFAYYVKFYDKKINGYRKRIFLEFDDIEEFTNQCKNISIERIPINGLGVNEYPLVEAHNRRTVAYNSRRNTNTPSHHVNSTGRRL